MPLFAIIAIDKPGQAQRREEYRAAHRVYSRDHVDITRLAGAIVDADGKQCGTLKIFEADSAAQLRELYVDEPFFKAGIYESLQIVEWKLAFNQFPIVDYPPPSPQEAELAKRGS